MHPEIASRPSYEAKISKGGVFGLENFVEPPQVCTVSLDGIPDQPPFSWGFSIFAVGAQRLHAITHGVGDPFAETRCFLYP